MKSFSIAGYQFDKELLTETFYQNACSKTCQGRCCQGSVYMSGEEMDRVYAHLDGLRTIMRPLQNEPQRWFVFEADVLDDSHPGSPKVCGAPAVEEHPDFTDADDFPDIAYGDGKHQACIFLTLDRHCAMQVYAERLGKHKWDLKPFYCWLFPLTAEEGTITIDERSFGMCFMPSDQAVPLYRLVKQELTHLIGEEGYLEVEQLALLASVLDGR